jgi:hypothetical protein
MTCYEQALELALTILKTQLKFWEEEAPALKLDPRLCRSEALRCELSILKIIDESLE